MIKITKKIVYAFIVMVFLNNSILYSAPYEASIFSEGDGGIKSMGYLDTADALREEPGNVVGDLIVTGDSYGGYLVSFLKAFHGYNIEKNKYCRPQKTVVDNYEIYELAFITRFENVVLSIGFNDYALQTDLNTFYEYVTSLAKLAKHYDKRLILHSYLDTPFKHESEKYSYQDYDLELRQIAHKYDNVEYVDVTDMGNNVLYLLEDGIHYNEKMYLQLYERIQLLLLNKANDQKVIIYNN